MSSVRICFTCCLPHYSVQFNSSCQSINAKSINKSINIQALVISCAFDRLSLFLEKLFYFLALPPPEYYSRVRVGRFVRVDHMAASATASHQYADWALARVKV